MNERIFPAQRDELENVLSYLEEELDMADCPLKVSMQLQVALEEMFINVASYAYSVPGGTVQVRISTENGMVTISLIDGGVPFNPLAKADPNVEASAEERPIGGLGIFMVKKTMDEVAYEYVDGKNIFTMKKRLP